MNSLRKHKLYMIFSEGCFRIDFCFFIKGLRILFKVVASFKLLYVKRKSARLLQEQHELKAEKGSQSKSATSCCNDCAKTSCLSKEIEAVRPSAWNGNQWLIREKCKFKGAWTSCNGVRHQNERI